MLPVYAKKLYGNDMVGSDLQLFLVGALENKPTKLYHLSDQTLIRQPISRVILNLGMIPGVSQRVKDLYVYEISRF